MKFKTTLPLFLLLTLFTFNSCETKKSDDDTTTLLGLLLLNRANSSVQTACGRLNTNNSVTPSGKTSAVKGQTVTLSMENVSGEFRTVVIFTGVNNGDVITFATEATSFTYPASVDIEYSAGSSCPFVVSGSSTVASGLGLTLNSATADRLVYTASGTTPSSFSINMNVRQQSAANGRTITVNY